MLKKDFHLLPIILGGDFNIDFNSLEVEKLATFLQDTFSLTMSSDRTKATTSGSTTIDAVF